MTNLYQIQNENNDKQRNRWGFTYRLLRIQSMKLMCFLSKFQTAHSLDLVSKWNKVTLFTLFSLSCIFLCRLICFGIYQALMWKNTDAKSLNFWVGGDGKAWTNVHIYLAGMDLPALPSKVDHNTDSNECLLGECPWPRTGWSAHCHFCLSAQVINPSERVIFGDDQKTRSEILFKPIKIQHLPSFHKIYKEFPTFTLFFSHSFFLN